MRKFSTDEIADFQPATRLSVAGSHPEEAFGFVNPPVYHGSTVLFPSVKDMAERTNRYGYGRRGSPTMSALQEAIGAIEGGVGVVLCPSGLSAVSTALLAVLKAGDHLLMTDSAYDPIRTFCDNVLARFGVEITYYDPLIGGDIASLFKPNTRAVFTESPGSLTFEVQDIPAIAEAAHARDILVLLDNTWATPLYFPAHARGADISIWSGTKYLSGHSDILFGTVSANARAWRALAKTHGDTGMCVGPDDVYLALRGLRTLAVRLEAHQKSALELARWLETRPEVSRVLHPALESHPGHAIWKRDFLGSTGLFSVVLKSVPHKAVAAFLDHLKFFGLGYSWGGFESLAIPFRATPYRTATRWEPEGPTIRFQIGLEDVRDLKADLEEGFARLNAAAAE
ncbi:cystathionine beta-lyase [Pseudochelatococcus contaminans]|uniref:Cystathionine beta-lyase n=1 Tax=Pseudochelatococcus contaminans TaxID=1538103 RepID=A0A7W5Z6K7_9HYPH|nr:cystathionine beta-lyase [Pseudochelatococcus contaminans]MBB3810780.1 cystathionine beta-lyase [Pseudochelatococcus contaminans]